MVPVCDPLSLTIATVASTAAGSLLSIQAQNGQASYQNSLRELNIKNAAKAGATEQATVNKRLIEEEAAAVNKTMELDLQAKKARGTALASATNEGQSLDALLYDFERQKGKYSSILEGNLKDINHQGLIQKESVNADIKRTADALPTAQKVGVMAAIPSIIGASLDAYQIYYKK